MAGTLPVPDFHADPDDRTDLRPRGRGGKLVAFLFVLVLAGAAAWFWWQKAEPVQPAPPMPAQVQAPVQDGTPPAAAQPAPPAVQYPVPAPAAAEAVAPEGVAEAVQQLLGRGAALLITDNLARRIVATIDQLGREHAPPSLWPVKPAPERFLVEQRGDATVIAAGNAARYTPIVDALTSVDPAAIAALYRRLYPVLDQAWRDLGMGQHYLNDRVIAVIDILLRTPQPAGPIAVRLTEVKGPIPSTRPWLRYEFADPQLEALPAGQKILLRLAPSDRRKVHDQLVALRRHLVLGK